MKKKSLANMVVGSLLWGGLMALAFNLSGADLSRPEKLWIIGGVFVAELAQGVYSKIHSDLTR